MSVPCYPSILSYTFVARLACTWSISCPRWREDRAGDGWRSWDELKQVYITLVMETPWACYAAGKYTTASAICTGHESNSSVIRLIAWVKYTRFVHIGSNQRGPVWTNVDHRDKEGRSPPFVVLRLNVRKFFTNCPVWALHRTHCDLEQNHSVRILLQNTDR